MQKISLAAKYNGRKVVVVPTMGYLHAGHLSLIKKAGENGDLVVTTLFVNPTQFAPNEDFEAYPRDLERDSLMAEESGADILFYPAVDEMYPGGYNTNIRIKGISEKLEGEKRPTHFNGVATVVAKLFNATLPDIAVFGQKDYQQTLVVKQLVRDLNFPVQIIVSPTVREADGLAMSSRNTYLSPDLRSKAGIIFEALEAARMAVEDGERDRKIINAVMLKHLRSVAEIKVDYVCAVDASTLEEAPKFEPGQRIALLIAVYLGKTRLIDNALVTLPPAEFPPRKKRFVEGL